MQHFYEQWGPSASTCIKLSQNPVDEATHEDNVKHAAAEFVKIAPTTFTSINAIMSPLLSIQPKGKDGSGRKIPVAYMATDQIKTIISYAAADAKARVQSKFFFKLSKQPGFQASMDQMFKTFVLSWLCFCPGNEPFLCLPAVTGLPVLQIIAFGKKQSCNSLLTICPTWTTEVACNT
jgi:hypothetical protein